MEEVKVEDLAKNLLAVEMMIKITRMRLAVVIRTKGEKTQIIPMIRTIEIKEEEEEGKELEEEASVDNVSTTVKKGIENLNVLSTKEGMIEETTSYQGLWLSMKMQNCHILKMLKEEKS